MADLLLGRWVRGEASERGITVSDSEVSNRLDQIIEQEFGGQKQFEQFLKQAHFTEEEASQRVEVQLLSDQIQQEVLPEDASVSDSEIEDFYNANIEQFQQPETRDMRRIVNKDQAKVEQAKALLEQDDSPASWKKVAARFSTEDATKDVGGLVEGVTVGQSEPALEEQIFSAAEGQLVGPFKGENGLLPDPGREDHPGGDDAAQRSLRADRAAARSGEAAAGRPGLPAGLPREVDVAELLRRRLRDRPLRELHAQRPGGPGRSPGDPDARRPTRASGGVPRAADSGAAAGADPAHPDPGGPDHRPAPGTLPPGGRRRPPPPRSRVDSEALDALARLDEITRRLRRECPWDREQDERSIVPHTVEEAYELADAAESGDDPKLVDELGDVLFQVHFLALLLEERGAGSLAEVAEGTVQKLIRRHPHIFGEAEAKTAGEVLRNWDRIKREEEGRGAGEPFADVPENLPALLYARKLQRRAHSAGLEGAEPEQRIAAPGDPRGGRALDRRGAVRAGRRRPPPSRRPRAGPARLGTALPRAGGGLTNFRRPWQRSSASTHVRSSTRGETRRSRSR